MMDLETAYSIIENCSGFADESSSVGEAWAFVVNEVKRLRKELGSANDAIILLKTRLKQLQKAVEIEHDQGESFLTQIKELREENATLRKDKERIECENNQFRRYVIETGCSYTQTESDCECDYDYPWPCDHCPIVEHNRDLFD